MGDVINLRNARKQKDRDNKNKESAVKRVQFGTSRSEKNIVELNQQKHNKKLDDHQLDKNPADDESDDQNS